MWDVGCAMCDVRCGVLFRANLIRILIRILTHLRRRFALLTAATTTAMGIKKVFNFVDVLESFLGRRGTYFPLVAGFLIPNIWKLYILVSTK